MNKPIKTTDKHGDTFYKLNGVLHRTDGPAVEWANGRKEWYTNGKRHRTDGPAVEWADGTKAWWVNGERHRTDGPAVELADGSKEWFINYKEITTENYQSFVNDYPDLINRFLTYEALNK